MLKLGINTVLYKGFGIKNALKSIKLAGYDGAEISAIQGMCEHLVLDAWETQCPLVKAAAKEAGVVNVGPGGKSDDEESFLQCVETLKDRAALAAQYGVKLCCKAHVGGAIYSTPTTLRAVKMIDTPSFGVDMDPSHIHRAGEKPEDALASVVQYMGHVHIRDCKGNGPSPGAPIDQICGRGEINLYGYFKALTDANYDGPVCLEIIGPEQNLVQAQTIAAESYGYMNAILKQLGAR